MIRGSCRNASSVEAQGPPTPLQDQSLITSKAAGFPQEKRVLRQRLAALRHLRARQDLARRRGGPFTCSRRQLARELGFTPARMEQIELACRLRLLQALARQAPDVLTQLGASARQVDFLESIRISPGQARRLWKRWAGAGAE